MLLTKVQLLSLFISLSEHAQKSGTFLERAHISGNLPKQNGGRRLEEKAFPSKLQGSK